MVVAAVILVVVALTAMQKTRSKRVLASLFALLWMVRVAILLEGWPSDPCGGGNELLMVGVVAEIGGRTRRTKRQMLVFD